MRFIDVEQREGVAILSLSRGKVNAINDEVVSQLKSTMEDLEGTADIKSVILTGQGSFFSFGFDIPEFISYSPDAFTEYLNHFTDLYTYMFLYPKPLLAAINGHAIGGGCMLTLSCDHRIMVSGKAKISLNEINFGASVFAGSAEMLRFCAGNKNATEVLYSGTMYPAEQARDLGLVNTVTTEDKLMDEALKLARELGQKTASAFAGMKLLLRKPVAEEMRRNEKVSIKEFVDIWYSEPTWEQVKKIKIH